MSCTNPDKNSVCSVKPNNSQPQNRVSFAEEIPEEETENEETPDQLGLEGYDEEDEEYETVSEEESEETSERIPARSISDLDVKSRSESGICVETISSSHSSFYRNLLNFFPPLNDPGIDDAFYFVEPEFQMDNIGVELYKKNCKEFEIVPIKRVVNSLPTNCLDLKYYGITPKQTRALAESLKINTYVEEFILQDNWLVPEQVNLLNEILQRNSTIKILNLQECRIGVEGATSLAEGLYITQTIKELNLSFNNLGDKGLAELRDALSENMSINVLNLSHNELTEESGEIFQAVLSDNRSIIDLDLSWNSFCTGPGNKKLFNGLTNNLFVKKLNLAWNGIGTKQAMQPITKYLKKTEILEYLDLSNNRITQDAFSTLRRGVLKNASLKTLRVGNNLLTPDEAYRLTTVLIMPTSSSPIDYLDMENTLVEKNFLTLLYKMKQQGLEKTIIYGGILSNFKIYGPNVAEVLFKRCKLLAMKPKKKKAKKDFGHFILQLPETPVSKADFKKLIKKAKVKKLDNDLVNELMATFATKSGKVICNKMRNAYMDLWPDTVLPPPSAKKSKKKGKKDKKKKDVEEAPAIPDQLPQIDMPHPQVSSTIVRDFTSSKNLLPISTTKLTTDKEASTTITIGVSKENVQPNGNKQNLLW